MTKDLYVRLMKYFELHRPFCRVLCIAEHLLEAAVVFAYSALLIYFIYSDFLFCLRSAATSLIALYLCTLIRFVKNSPRPYEVYETLPAINKDTRGQSFPSRHLTSTAVISVSILKVSLGFGIAAVAVTVIMGILRVLLGVHFIKDVTVGAVIGFVIGIIGIFII